MEFICQLVVLTLVAMMSLERCSRSEAANSLFVGTSVDKVVTYVHHSIIKGSYFPVFWPAKKGGGVRPLCAPLNSRLVCNPWD